jgi:SAM-dependent methyltransferase
MSTDIYERLIAAHYDALYSTLRDPSGDRGFYLALAEQPGGPVLELGCGTGRVLLPIAKRGIECVGIEASRAMLDVFRAKNPPSNVRLVEGRMETFELDERFRLVTIPFRALSHLLSVESQLACLERVRRHLAPGGTLALDVFDPKLERIAMSAEPESLAVKFREGAHEIRRWDTIRRDATTQVMTVTFRFEGGPPELTGSTEIQLRWFYRYELEHLLVRAGFSDVSFFGGFDRRPWAAGGETIVVARV